MLYKCTRKIIQESIGSVILKLVEYGKFMLVYKNVNNFFFKDTADIKNRAYVCFEGPLSTLIFL